MSTIRYPVRFDPLPDMDCEVECTLEWRDGEPVVDVTDVSMGGESLFRHSEPDHRTLMMQLACQIASRAEDDDYVLTMLLEAEGVYHVGQPNNPDSHWRAVR